MIINLLEVSSDRPSMTDRKPSGKPTIYLYTATRVSLATAQSSAPLTLAELACVVPAITLEMERWH